MQSEPLVFTTFYRHGAPNGDAETPVEITLTAEHGTAGAEMSLKAREPGLDGEIAIEKVRLDGPEASASTTARLEPGYASELVYRYHANGTRVSPELRLVVEVSWTDSQGRRHIEHRATSRDEPELILNVLLQSTQLDTSRVAVSSDPAYPVINSLELFIQNPGTSALIEFDNEDGLTPEDPLPPIGQPPVGPRLDRLYIYFPYGAASGTLTTREQAAAITVSPAPDNDSWYVSELSDPEIGPYWILFPKNEYVLAAHESVRFLLTGVTTFNPPGLTHMNLKKQVTGYQVATDPSTVLLLTDAPPQILDFTSSQGSVAAGTTVDLSWQTWNAESCELRPENVDDLPAQMAAYPVRVLRDVNFSLTAVSPSKKTSPEATRQVFVDPVRIDSFEASPPEIVRGLPVALRWESYSARSLLLEPGVGLVCEDAVGCGVGERVVYPQETTEYRLTATGEEGPVSKSVVVEVQEFTPFPTPPFPDPVQPLVAESGTDWAEKLLGIDGWELSSGAFDAAGQFVSSRGMTNQPGLQSVVAGGPYQVLGRISYVAIAGPGAPYVDVGLYPPTEDDEIDYQGWNGQEWVDGPAVSVDGYFWYRLPVIWTAERQMSAVVYAKDYRSVQPLSFQLWAYKGVETEESEDE